MIFRLLREYPFCKTIKKKYFTTTTLEQLLPLIEGLTSVEERFKLWKPRLNENNLGRKDRVDKDRAGEDLIGEDLGWKRPEG